MKGRTIIHRALHGEQSNGSTCMKIHLYMCIGESGSPVYHWSLENEATGHRWFTRISTVTYVRMKERLSRNYRFRYLPVRQDSPKAVRVFEDVFYI